MQGISRQINPSVSPSTTHAILYCVSTPPSKLLAQFGPFNCNTPRRWKKPVDSARMRLEGRTLDPQFDKLMSSQRKLRMVLKYHELISKRRSHHVFVEMLARWRPVVGLQVRAGPFLHGLPHVFELYTHPMGRATCCRLTDKMRSLIEREARTIKDSESDAVWRLKKLLMMSILGMLHVHALWLVRRELGLPEDFRESILRAHPEDFALPDQETVALVSRDDALAVATVERWRERQYREKWLSEFETKHAFPLQFPTGFVLEKGFREKLRNWQRLPYLYPYDTAAAAAAAASDSSSGGAFRAKTSGALERLEKRVVAVLHELLSLTVEKMLPLERLAHFRRDLRLDGNFRELVLKHPGIFYVSTRAGVLTVFLRESYCKGRLVEPNPVYAVRREMMDLIALGTRCRRLVPSPASQGVGAITGRREPELASQGPGGGGESGDWVVPLVAGQGKRAEGLPDRK